MRTGEFWLVLRPLWDGDGCLLTGRETAMGWRWVFIDW